jgi:hypothetical protein
MTNEKKHWCQSARPEKVESSPSPAFDLFAFFAATECQPFHTGPDIAEFIRAMREEARY